MKRVHQALGERGAAMVEFALLLPLMVTMIFGIAELGYFLHAWVSVQHASEMGARYAVTGRATCDGGSLGRTGCINSEAMRSMNHMFESGARTTINTRSWKFPSYAAKTEGSAGQQCDAVEVEVRYNYKFQAPIISRLVPDDGNVVIVGKQRFINEPFLPCKG